MGKVASAAALGLIAAGGYFTYVHFAPPTSAATADNSATDEKSTATAARDSEPQDAEDPFGDAHGAPAADDESTPPRLAQHTRHIRPIQPAGDTRSGKARLSSSQGEGDGDDALLELPLDLDEPAPTTADEALDADSEPPLLRVSPGKAAPLTASASSDRENPEIKISATDSTDDALEGFDATDERESVAGNSATRPPALAATPIARTNVTADEPDGFESEDAAPRRASSRTIVVRSQGGIPPVSAGNDDWIVEDSPPPRSAAGASADPSPAMKIAPRHPAHSRAIASRPAGELRPASDTPIHGETYTVAPNDNFWVISRKRYGTARYFAALAKHNQEKIPDPQRLRAGMQVATPPAAVLEERYPDLIDKSGAGPAPAGSPEPLNGRPTFEKPASSRDATPSDSTSGKGAPGYFYSKSGAPMYRIGADDTLSSIAQRHLGRASRWAEIYEQNQDVLKNPENLTVGTVIRLPADASTVDNAFEAVRRR